MGDARRQGRDGDGTEPFRGHQDVRLVEVDGIEDVEYLEAQLEPPLARDREVLEQAQVELEEAGTGEEVPLASDLAGGGHLEERALVRREPLHASPRPPHAPDVR